MLSKQISSKTPTKLQYVERYVFMKEVNTQNLWTFELGTGEGINFPIWIIVGFQQKNRQDSQNSSNDTFHTPSVISSQFIRGAEKNPNSGMLLNYDDDDDFYQRNGQIEEAFKALTKDDTFNHTLRKNW